MRSTRDWLGWTLVASLATAGRLEGQQQAPDTANGKLARRITLDEVVVTATRTDQTLKAVPANVVVLTREAVRLSAANSIPDFLRLIPGFAMKDFQSSLVSNPSRQAPAFRGLGGTSASRTLVLVDGIPINDPFSGWVYWARVPLGLVDRAEVVRGGGAGVWGDRALGGVINIRTAEPRETRLDLSAEGGSFSTFRGTATGTYRKDRLGVLLSGDYFDTDGYRVVRPDLTGPIDVGSDSHDRMVFGRVLYDFTPTLQAHLAGSYLSDHRRSGTPLTTNETKVGDVRGGARLVTGGGSLLTFNGYASHSGFNQFVSTVSADRASETPTTDQYDVPSTSVGGTLQWSKAAFRRHHLSAGADGSWIEGGVNENYNYQQGQFVRRRNVTANQVVAGLYLEDAVTLGTKWRLLASTRFDRWQNRNAFRKEYDLVTGGLLVDSVWADRTRSNLSYSLGLRHETSAAFSWRASVYRSFRSPSLNELYRPFREAGNIITEMNPTLRPERLIGAELGADFNLSATVLGRVTTFWNRVQDPIFEATVALAGATGRVIAPCGFVPAGGICRQRQNLDALRTMGIETELEVHPLRDFSFWGSYTFNPTRVTAPAAQAALEGKLAKGTARHQFTLIGTYDNPAVILAAVTTRYVGSRFDDDLNTLPLGHHLLVDLRVERRLVSRSSAFLKVENLFDSEYEVTRAANGLVRVGGPRFAMGGIRVQW